MGISRCEGLFVLLVLFLPRHAWAAAPSAPAAPPTPSDLRRATRNIASVEASSAVAKQKAEALASDLGALALQHKVLDAALKKSKADLALHLRTGQTAYATPKAPPVPSKKTPPLPKLASLKKAKLEYAAFVQSNVVVGKDLTALLKNEADLEQQAEAANQIATAAETAVKDAQADAALLKTAAADKAAPAPAKAAAELAATQLKSVRMAATAATAAARKARSGSGFASATAFATRKAAATRDREQDLVKAKLVEATLQDVDARLALQNPAVPKCDLRRVLWRDMTYPWFPWGTLQHGMKLKDGLWVCDEPNPDQCSGSWPAVSDVAEGPDSALVLGDLDGDGKPEAALHVTTFCCDVTGVEVLLFKQDAECRLDFLGDVSLTNSSGTIVGGAFVADQPFARKGENIGLGAVSGREHVEWRLVRGKLTKTKSVVTVVPIE